MTTDKSTQSLTNRKWNLRYLKPPPVATYKNDKTLDITNLRKILESAIAYFENETHLRSDAALLSRIIYRITNKFRNDKGFKCMQKMNKMLCKYFEHNFLSVVNNFYDLLPRCAQPGCYLPTNDMLDYVIIRLQGLIALMSYLNCIAKEGAHLLEERIGIGHDWRVAFFAYGLVSRIWFLCTHITSFCNQMYKDIVPMRCLLKRRGNSWVGDDYEFPLSMENVLDVDHQIGESLSEDLNKDIIEEGLNGECAENIPNELITGKQGEGSSEDTQVPKQKSAFALLLEDEEMGDAIEKEETVVMQKKKTLKKRKSHKKKTTLENLDFSSLQLIENIHSFAVLKTFLKQESKVRKEDRSQCVYKNLDNLQWNMLLHKASNWSKKAATNEHKQSIFLNKAIDMLKFMLQL